VAGGDDRARRVADPDRDPDTVVLHQRYFPARGDVTRSRRHEGRFSSRVGLLDSPRLHV